MVAQSDREAGSGCGSVPGDWWLSGGVTAGDGQGRRVSASDFSTFFFSSTLIELLWSSQPLDFHQKIRKNTFYPDIEKKKQSVSLALKFPALLGLFFEEKGSTGASGAKIWGSRAELPWGWTLSWQGSSGDWDLPPLSDEYRKHRISNSNSPCLSTECELHIKVSFT